MKITTLSEDQREKEKGQLTGEAPKYREKVRGERGLEGSLRSTLFN